MREYLNRFIMLIPTLAGISIIAFFLGILSPGNPAEIALSRGGYEPTKEQIEKMESELGLDKPYHIQYINWFKEVIKGNFGKSYITGRDISEEIQKRFPKTLKLAIFAGIFTSICGIGLGIFIAWNKDTWIEKIMLVFLNINLSFPVFWIGLLLILVFSERLRWLPTSGYGSFRYMILPTLTLSLVPMSIIARLVRSSLLAEFGKSYYIALMTRGLSKKVLIMDNALPNAISPVLSMIGNFLGGILSGTVIIENIFAIPGLGSYAIESISTKDFPVLQAYVLISGIIYVIMNIVIDIFAVLINPKLRLGE